MHNSVSDVSILHLICQPNFSDRKINLIFLIDLQFIFDKKLLENLSHLDIHYTTNIIPRVFSEEKQTERTKL